MRCFVTHLQVKSTLHIEYLYESSSAVHVHRRNTFPPLEYLAGLLLRHTTPGMQNRAVRSSAADTIFPKQR